MALECSVFLIRNLKFELYAILCPGLQVVKWSHLSHHYHFNSRSFSKKYILKAFRYAYGTCIMNIHKGAGHFRELPHWCCKQTKMASEEEQGYGDERDEETNSEQEEPLLGSSWRSDRSRTSSCACRYRWVNRGALLVLLWNLLVFSYQYKALDSILKLIPSYKEWEPWEKVSATTAMQISLPFLLYPLAGWLADVKLGRYRVMKGSIWIMWLGSIILLIDSLLQYHFSYTHPNKTALQFLSLPVGIAVYALNAIGLAGFQANIIPFGIDQMEDGPAEQYSSFVHWYYWSRNFSLGLVLTIALYSSFSCPLSVKNTDSELIDRIDLIIIVSEVGFLSLSLLLDFFLSGMLIKEPKTQNPLQAVFKVSLFTVQHKRPVGQRSAMTYHRGYYSRSDLATTPYGGPFEVEEVEAVKTFWNMMVFLTAVATTSIPVFIVRDVLSMLIFRQKALYATAFIDILVFQNWPTGMHP